MFDKAQFLEDWADNYTPPIGYENSVVMQLVNSNSVSIVAQYFAYKKKEDFLFDICMRDNQTSQQEAGVYNKLKLKQRTGKEFEIAEVAWKYESDLHQMQINRRLRTIILLRFMPLAKLFLTEGYGGIISPYKDLMLVTQPIGTKIQDNFIMNNPEEGKRQRSLMARRLGFGAMKDFGWAFAKYTSEGKLQPL
jgi:hypothetical protein